MKTRSRTPTAAAVPVGLADAFKLITTDGATPCAATIHATRAYPHAQKIIALLHTEDFGRQDLEIEQELARAAESLFPSMDDRPADQVHESAGEAGFNVGFAVCWLLLRRINGQGGAR